MPATPATGARRMACYKCGKDGHMARDCSAPPSEWIKRQDGGSQAQANTQNPNPDGNTPAENMPENAEPLVALKEKNKRPKVTMELLKKTNGIPDVYHNFPEIFQRQCKGRGHEVSDLRRLLEMYKRWQDRIFPGVEFDSFIGDVEKLSNSNILKTELQDMRMDLIKVAQDIIDPREENAAGGDNEGAAGDGDMQALDIAQENNAQGDDMEMMIDDDELLELAAQGVEEEEEGAPQTNHPNQQQELEDAILDDDELLALLDEDMGVDEQPIEVAAAPGQQKEGVEGVAGPAEFDIDEIDDDELIALACEGGEDEGI